MGSNPRPWKGKGKWYDAARREILRRDGPGCAHCGATDFPLQLDHVVEVSDGGPEWDVSNLQLLDRWCHQAKTNACRRLRRDRRRGLIPPPAPVGPSREW